LSVVYSQAFTILKSSNIIERQIHFLIDFDIPDKL
jgi:hypothetical protein